MSDYWIDLLARAIVDAPFTLLVYYVGIRVGRAESAGRRSR